MLIEAREMRRRPVVSRLLAPEARIGAESSGYRAESNRIWAAADGSQPGQIPLPKLLCVPRTVE
jgi:hypothetical protein